MTKDDVQLKLMDTETGIMKYSLNWWKPLKVEPDQVSRDKTLLIYVPNMAFHLLYKPYIVRIYIKMVSVAEGQPVMGANRWL